VTASCVVINFRYHIVSLMAVFIALSVGIAVGVSLGPSVDQGLLQQAAQDRKQVTDLRAEIDRRNAIDDYREAWDQRVGEVILDGAVSGVQVAIVSMPEAPNAVVQEVTTAVEAAGGTVVREVEVNPDAFDPARTADVADALAPYGELDLNGSMSQGTMVGMALARSIAAPQAEDRDQLAVAIGDALTSRGLVSISRGPTAQAQLVIIIGAEATEPAPDAEQLAAHVDFGIALKGRAGVVLAGPNSAGLEGTDVQAVRSDSAGENALSTVDVADLSSGVTSTILAGQEQLLGNEGRHYGALAGADAPMPTLPVR
jgi:hypothetical protein